MKRFLFFICLSLSLFFLDRYGLARPARAVVELTTRPAKRWLWQTKSGVILKFQDWQKIGELVRLEGEVLELREEKRELEIEKERLVEENEAMRKLLGAPLPMDWHFQPAQVLGETEGFLMIDQGEVEGVKEGMIVVWGKALIGRVEAVTPHLAKVKTPHHQETAILAKTTRASGVIKEEKGEIYLMKILQGERVGIGDVVLTSGVDGFYPADLIIGEVIEVFIQEEQPFKKARLQPAVGYPRLKTVFLIKD